MKKKEIFEYISLSLLALLCMGFLSSEIVTIFWYSHINPWFEYSKGINKELQDIVMLSWLLPIFLALSYGAWKGLKESYPKDKWIYTFAVLSFVLSVSSIASHGLIMASSTSKQCFETMKKFNESITKTYTPSEKQEWDIKFSHIINEAESVEEEPTYYTLWEMKSCEVPGSRMKGIFIYEMIMFSLFTIEIILEEVLKYFRKL